MFLRDNETPQVALEKLLKNHLETIKMIQHNFNVESFLSFLSDFSVASQEPITVQK